MKKPKVQDQQDSADGAHFKRSKLENGWSTRYEVEESSLQSQYIISSMCLSRAEMEGGFEVDEADGVLGLGTLGDKFKVKLADHPRWRGYP